MFLLSAILLMGCVFLPLKAHNFKEYELVTKEKASDYLFGYTKDYMCVLRQDENDTFKVHIYNLYDKSENYTYSITYAYANPLPIACFSTKKYSYVLIKEGGFTNVYRNKILRHAFWAYDQMTYDHINERLYMANNRVLYEINIDQLDKLFEEDSADFLLEKSKITHLDDYSDIKITNGQLFLIKNHKVYTSFLNDDTSVQVTEINTDKFNFVLYSHQIICQTVLTGQNVSIYFYFFLLFVPLLYII